MLALLGRSCRHVAGSSGHACPLLARSMQSTAYACMPDITVPPLGESVSEGTISTVLKKAGDSVSVDEVVAQLETDKVTIDMKSAYAGIISALSMKVGDIVKPGTVLAVVGGGGSGAAPVAPSFPAATPQAAASSSSAAGAGAGDHGRMPMIKFPQRIRDGHRISDLPEAEQLGASSHVQPASSPPPAPKPAAPTAAAPRAAPIAAAVSEVPKAPSAKKSSNTVWLDEAPARRSPTKSEMELINNGGAW